MDFQTITVQEAPETAPPGQLPRSVDVVLEGALVDLAKPGDRVSVVGIYRAAPQKATGQITGLLRAVVVANNVEVLSGQAVAIRSTPAEIQAMRAFVAKQTRIVHKKDRRGRDVKDGAGNPVVDRKKTLEARWGLLRALGDSLAPSIWGHELVKQALILQLLGGVGKTLENGTQLRGECPGPTCSPARDSCGTPCTPAFVA